VELLRGLTGAEDAAVVNNNAGAVMLALAAVAHGREVIVSRGELIEIGGSFRIPDVMRLSGARLIEVGTTNKTRLADYERAITDDTALLLKVHRSNFEIVGFSEDTSLDELVELGRRRGVAVMNDLGSGALLSRQHMQDLGLNAEPGVREAVATGCDLVTFSGDKLLGGPQAGLIAGKTDAVSAVRKHPLMRALRPDKLSIAALEATLGLYRDHRLDELPTLAMLGATLEQLRERALAVLSRIRSSRGIEVAVVPCESTVGGGAMPTVQLPSWGLSLSGRAPDDLDRALRQASPPVVARIVEDQLILDLRTVHRRVDQDALVSAIESLGEPA
jgi:L-seryl-tRNA(Ser) seleniumtransferase